MEIKHNHMEDKGQDVNWDLSEKTFPLAFHEMFSQVCITLALNILLIKDGLSYLDLY